MSDNPVLLLVMIFAGAYVFRLWWVDARAAAAGCPNRRALPGARFASVRACVIAGVGALLILVGEVFGELWLGLSEEQSEMTVLFGVYSLSAAFVEELIFRGFLVVEGRGELLKWAGAVGASVAFALAHPFLWEWEEGFRVVLTAKGFFSAGVVFVLSLWFYVVRFAGFNKSGSLLPCVVGHLVKNIGVIGVKFGQGFLVGWW